MVLAAGLHVTRTMCVWVAMAMAKGMAMAMRMALAVKVRQKACVAQTRLQAQY